MNFKNLFENILNEANKDYLNYENTSEFIKLKKEFKKQFNKLAGNSDLISLYKKGGANVQKDFLKKILKYTLGNEENMYKFIDKL